MPLIAGLSLSEFTGVLAHEFGHFSQRSAMRLSYVIRSINAWFARVVYERDQWDVTLNQAARDGGHWGIQLVAHLCRLMVWLSRRVLWCLMIIGHLFGSMLLRQMEFDADKYEVRAVGSAQAQETSRNLRLLGISMQLVYGQLSRTLNEGRLPDSVPVLVANRARELPKDAIGEIFKAQQAEKGSWFDTHPTDAARMRAMAAQNQPGFFHVEAPATSLFQNFPVLSRLLTRQFYTDSLGPRASKVQLVKVEAIEAERRDQNQKARALETYLGGVLHPVRPVFFSGSNAESDPAETLLRVRSEIAAAVQKAQPACAEWDQADDRLLALEQVATLANGNVKRTDFKKLGLTSADEAVVRQRRLQVQSVLRSTREALDYAAGLGLERIRAAIAIEEAEAAASAPPAPMEETYDIAEGPSQLSWLASRMQTLSAIRESTVHTDDLRRYFLRQQALLEHLQSHQQDQRYIDEVLTTCRKMGNALSQLRDVLRSTPYIYRPEGRNLTLSTFILGEPVSNEDVGATMNAAQNALNQIYSLYMRVMAELAERAESIEARIGLEPIVFPKPKA